LSELADRYRNITERIAKSAQSAGRSLDEITLIVVTKNHPVQLALDLLDLGARDFGENRDQEAAPKAAELAQSSKQSVNWHFIGQLQTNKVKSVLGYAASLHSLDRTSLLEELIKRTAERENPLPVFIQVNLTADPARGGVNPAELEPFATRVLQSAGLSLRGLMGVAGLGVDPRVDFERLRDLGEVITGLESSANGLSMGMSEDFEVAIELGATHLRIGSAITGIRPT
jgi:PLP dependent protein